MAHVFVISGLGADRSVFSKLDWGKHHVTHLDWIPPKKKESLRDYALRLVEGHDVRDAYVLGLSLGGMMAWEIGSEIPVRGVISLSSITRRSELPRHLRWGGAIRLYKWFPIHWFCHGNRLTRWSFGVKSKTNKAVFDTILEKMDRHFLDWSLEAVTNWKASESEAEVDRIHGANDLILPRRKAVKYDFIVPDGGHLMVLEQPEEVGKIIHEILNREND